MHTLKGGLITRALKTKINFKVKHSCGSINCGILEEKEFTPGLLDPIIKIKTNVLLLVLYLSRQLALLVATQDCPPRSWM